MKNQLMMLKVNVTGPTLDVDADVDAGNHIVVGGPAVNAASQEST
ncbi:MAG: hypothetical protein ACLFPL_04255 [Candidatus Nanoarchaeia archaeon]